MTVYARRFDGGLKQFRILLSISFFGVGLACGLSPVTVAAQLDSGLHGGFFGGLNGGIEEGFGATDPSFFQQGLGVPSDLSLGSGAQVPAATWRANPNMQVNGVPELDGSWLGAQGFTQQTFEEALQNFNAEQFGYTQQFGAGSWLLQQDGIAPIDTTPLVGPDQTQLLGDVQIEPGVLGELSPIDQRLLIEQRQQVLTHFQGMMEPEALELVPTLIEQIGAIRQRQFAINPDWRGNDQQVLADSLQQWERDWLDQLEGVTTNDQFETYLELWRKAPLYGNALSPMPEPFQVIGPDIGLACICGGDPTPVVPIVGANGCPNDEFSVLLAPSLIGLLPEAGQDQSAPIIAGDRRFQDAFRAIPFDQTALFGQFTDGQTWLEGTAQRRLSVASHNCTPRSETLFFAENLDLRTWEPKERSVSERLLPNSFGPVVALRDGAGSSFCSGVLLNEDWVLTAAHCFCNGKSAETIFVGDSATGRVIRERPGALRANYATAAQPKFQDPKFCTKYDEARSQATEASPAEDIPNDLALLKVISNLSETTKAAVLPSYPIWSDSDADEIAEAWIVGFGYRDGADLTGKKLFAPVDVHLDGCSEGGAYADECFAGREFVTLGTPGQETEVDSCSGDSGGAVIATLAGHEPWKRVLAGIIVRGLDQNASGKCGLGGINIDLRHPPSRNWIFSTIKEG